MAAKPDIGAEKKALTTALSESRSNPISFAALVTKDGIVFQSDKKKPVDTVRKAAKALGGGTRGAWGQMTTSGSSIVLICDEEPAAKIEQMVRKHFADRGHTVKVEVQLRADTEAPAKPGGGRNDSPGDDPTPRDEPKPAVAREVPPKAAQPDLEPDEDLRKEPDPDDRDTGGRETQDPRLDTRQRQDAPDPVQDDPDGDAPDPDEDPDDPDDEDDIAAQAGDLDKLLKAARKKPFFFALMLGQEAPVLKAHRRRPAGKLVKEARQDGGSNRGAWGTMRVDGKEVVLTCEGAPPKSLAKKARRFLKDQGLAYRVVCVLPTGEVLDRDDGDEDEADTGGAPRVAEAPATATDPAPPPIPDELNARLVTADQILALFADAPRDAARLKTVRDAAAQKAKDGDHAGAAVQLDQLARLARETPRTPEQRRARSLGALKGMKDEIRETAHSHGFAKGYLTDLCTSCVQAADAGDFDKAERKVVQVRRALSAAKTPPLDTAALDRTVAALMPREETEKADYARIVTTLKPVLTTDHPEKPAVRKSLQAYKDATIKRDRPGVLSAIGDLRRHEATIEDVGPPLGQGGALRQTLSPEAVDRLSARLAAEKKT